MKKIWLLVLFGLASCAANSAREEAKAAARAECEAQRQQTGQSDYGCVIVMK